MFLPAFCVQAEPGGYHMHHLRKLKSWILRGGARREELYDRLYSLNWGETTTNNYGFAPAEGHQAERFQLQLYSELLDCWKTGTITGGFLVLSRSAADAAAASATWHATCPGKPR